MIGKEKIQVFAMGGTIDSHWDGKSDTAIVNEKSVLCDYFQSLVLYANITTEVICMKDSRQLLPDDLNALLEAIEKTDATKILVTHGTYTMADTARFLKANLSRTDQTIILTGSMVPLQGIQPSDAPFNLGFAVAKVADMPTGIYLAMNGAVFNPEEVAKNIAEGKFFSVFDKKQ